jgi:hypothetical protein
LRQAAAALLQQLCRRPQLPQGSVATPNLRRLRKKPSLVSAFRYLRPEPVLVRWSQLHKNGLEMTFFALRCGGSSCIALVERLPFPSRVSRYVRVIFPILCALRAGSGGDGAPRSVEPSAITMGKLAARLRACGRDRR